MNATLGRLLSLLARGPAVSSHVLDGFVDSLLQKFENCRPGLTEEQLLAGEGEVAVFFAELYEKEIPRLKETIRLEEPHLTDAARGEYLSRIDELVRKVLLPAYVRLATAFTPRERNGFYRLREALHGLERTGWAGLGVLLGSFVVWAPFIPVWEKEAVLPFAITGLLVPEIRRGFAVRRYEKDINELVARAESEIARIDTAYLTSSEAVSERTATAETTTAASATPAPQGATGASARRQEA